MLTEIEEFGDFAETKLNNHLIELHTHHINLRPLSDEMMTEAYEAHRKILSKELEQKLDAIEQSIILEKAVKEGLLAIKRKYVNNLIWNRKM